MLLNALLMQMGWTVMDDLVCDDWGGAWGAYHAAYPDRGAHLGYGLSLPHLAGQSPWWWPVCSSGID